MATPAAGESSMLPAHRGAVSPFFERLRDPALYLAAAERVRTRQRERGDDRPLVADGPFLGAIHDLPALAKKLAREVGRCSYELAAVSSHRAALGGKERTLYRARPLDEVVLVALAAALADALEPRWSDQLYSYRAGRSSRTAIRAFADFLREHARARPN